MTTTNVGATKREWIGLAALILVVLAVSIDNTVLAFALPHIAADLNPTASMQLWLMDSYPLVLSALLVPMGNLGDRIGRRKLLLIGTTGFAVFSILAALSPSAQVLLMCRIALGVFGATLMPCTLSLLRSTFQVRAERRFAIAIWSIGFATGGALGPVLGGFLLEHFHWGSVFYLHLPFVLPLLVLAPILIDESKDPHPGPVDLISIVLSALTITPIAFGLKHMAGDGFDLIVVVSILAGLACGTLLVRRLLGQKNPMLDVRLFVYPAFTGSILINMLSCAAYIGLVFFMSQHLQLVEGLSPMRAALIMVPGTIVMVIMTLVVVRIVGRFSIKNLITAGLVGSTLTYTVFALFGATIPIPGIIAAFAVLAAGIAIAETLSNDVILASVPSSKAGAASAVSETAYELGAVIGTSVLGGALTAFYRTHLVVPDGVPAEAAATAESTLGSALAVAEDLGGTVGAQLAENAKHAFDSGIIWSSGLGAILSLATVIIALTMLGSANKDS